MSVAGEVVVLDVNPFMSLFNFIICFIACLFVYLPFKRIYVFVLNSSFLNKIYTNSSIVDESFLLHIPSHTIHSALCFCFHCYPPVKTSPTWQWLHGTSKRRESGTTLIIYCTKHKYMSKVTKGILYIFMISLEECVLY